MGAAESKPDETSKERGLPLHDDANPLLAMSKLGIVSGEKVCTEDLACARARERERVSGSENEKHTLHDAGANFVCLVQMIKLFVSLLFCVQIYVPCEKSQDGGSVPDTEIDEEGYREPPVQVFRGIFLGITSLES